MSAAPAAALRAPGLAGFEPGGGGAYVLSDEAGRHFQRAGVPIEPTDAETPGDPPAREITGLLRRHAAGDSEALDRLIPLVYDDLRKIAHDRLRSERPSHTLDTTAVVHEAYLRLVDVSDPGWNGRAHFFAVSSKLIRNLLIDYARRRGAEKRGGGAIRVPLSEELDAARDREPATVDLLALDEALTALARLDARLEQVVECRFFGGLTVRETARVIGVSVRTVERDWTRAKAYLYRALASSDPADEPG